MEKSRPFISVIIPTYDRPTQLFKCLCAFAAQDYPRDRFEVVVVGDGNVAQVNDPIGSRRHQLDMTLLSDHVPDLQVRETMVLHTRRART